MDILSTFGLVVTFATLAYSIFQMIQIRKQRRQAEALNRLLMILAAQSFMNQHLPIWIAWSLMTGLRFHLEIEKKEAENS